MKLNSKFDHFHSFEKIFCFNLLAIKILSSSDNLLTAVMQNAEWRINLEEKTGLKDQCFPKFFLINNKLAR